MTDKWWLRDWLSPQRTVVGSLTNVHNSGGIVSTHPGDSDTNVWIVPNPETADLLRNRFGGPNTATPNKDTIECEVNVTEDGREGFENWLSTMLGLQVTAQGVYVDDVEHDNKSELHPLDIVVAQVGDTQITGGWLDSLINKFNLQLGVDLLLYRFAAASDDRESAIFDGPPLAHFTRVTTVSCPIPPHPPGPEAVLEIDVVTNTANDHAVAEAGPDLARNSILLAVTCDGRGFDGPGYITGEVAVYWLSAALDFDNLLEFDRVQIGESKTKTLHIRNNGLPPLEVSVAGPAPGIPFNWSPLSTTLIVTETATVDVQFTPVAEGHFIDSLFIDLPAASGGPFQVTLNGFGFKGGGF